MQKHKVHKKAPSDKNILSKMYETLTNQCHVKDLANPSCQKLDTHSIHIAAEAECLKTRYQAHF